MWTPSHSIPWNILIWAFLSTTVINLPRIVKWPLTFFHFCGSKHATVRQRALLTRLRQNGRPCAMMLMLKIFRTFWGGNCSLVTSLGSARSSGWSPGGTCEVSFPQTVGIFLRAPDDEKRGIGQCRSIAEPPFYCIISRNPRWRSGACCRFFLSQTYRHFPRWTSSPESPPCPSITLLNILGVWHQCCATARRSSCFQALRGGSPKPVSPPSDGRCAICSHDPPSVECEPAVVQRSAHVCGAPSLWSDSDPLLSVPTHLIKFTLFHQNCVVTGDRVFGDVSYPVSAKRLRIFQEWTTQQLGMRDPCVLNRDPLDRRTNKVGWC